MLSDTGLFPIQPSRFEEFENSEDFLSYAPISDLSLSSSESTLPDLSNKLNDSFLSYFTDSETMDCLDDWDPQTTLPALNTPSCESSNSKTPKNLQSPFQSPEMDWSSSPISTSASDADLFSPIHGSSKHSPISFEGDSYFDFTSKPSNSLPESQTPPQRCSSSPEIEAPNFSEEEIAKLWTIAFPESQVSSPAIQPETIIISRGNDSPTIVSQKRKSASQSPSFTPELSPPSSSKRRHVEEKEPRRYSKRTSTAPSTSTRPPKGSKVNHNLIEKRYRSSLNEKIAFLRDTLPRSYSNSCNSSDEDEVFVKREDQEEFDGQLMEGKQSTKGAVLSDAARYIRFLEGKVNRLEERLSCVSAF